MAMAFSLSAPSDDLRGSSSAPLTPVDVLNGQTLYWKPVPVLKAVGGGQQTVQLTVRMIAGFERANLSQRVRCKVGRRGIGQPRPVLRPSPCDRPALHSCYASTSQARRIHSSCMSWTSQSLILQLLGRQRPSVWTMPTSQPSSLGYLSAASPARRRRTCPGASQLTHECRSSNH